MAKVEGMRGKDNSKPVFVKKGAPNIAPTFRNNNVNNNNKRLNAGRDVAGDKRVKVEGRQLAENYKFGDKLRHRAEECWKKLGEFLVAGEQEIIHTKPFFFPVASAATCTDSHLGVDQRRKPCERDGPIGRVLRSCRDSIPVAF
ncbi:hypothetical protein Taro_053031 [Colocasia esculenta]|uniref:Uncharacterized protein n=1 Tax=Colocasia esculenta TaxID=4460 RepID=A0A843XJU5_COLES|nr:hypothetical protein [Colocasia esculenta]